MSSHVGTDRRAVCMCICGGGANSYQPFPKAASPVHTSESSWSKQLIKAMHMGASSRMNFGRNMNIQTVASI